MTQCKQFVVDAMEHGRRQCRRQALDGEALCKRHRNKQRKTKLNIGKQRILDRRIRRRWP
jgi:hypothetical protein